MSLPGQEKTMDATLFRAWVVEAARLVVENADHLTHLDAAIGDADHGINLSRGIKAAVAMLDETAPATPGAVLTTVGRALISKTGGASAALILQALATVTATGEWRTGGPGRAWPRVPRSHRPGGSTGRYR